MRGAAFEMDLMPCAPNPSSHRTPPPLQVSICDGFPAALPIPQVAWAFAKLDCPAPRVLRHAGSKLAARTSAFNDKEASNVLWALASQVRRRRWLEISREVFEPGRQWRARRRGRESSRRLNAAGLPPSMV